MKMRKISVLLLVLSIFVLAGCDGISGVYGKKDDGQTKKITVNGSVHMQKKAKTLTKAYPSFVLNEDINWTITAVYEDENVSPVVVEDVTDGNFSATLTAEGKWAFSAVGKIDDTVILQSHLPVEVEVYEQKDGLDAEPVKISINVYPVFSNEYSGSINLSFYDDTMEYEDQITEIRYSFVDEAIEGGSITFNNQKTAVLSLNNIPAGAYTVTFDVYREQNDKLYSLTEVINVFSGFVTDVWQTTGDNTFILTDELFFDFDEQEFPSDLEYPIVLWNLWTESECEWSASTGYGVFSEISEKAKLEDGIRFGKDIKSFCFDAKNNKIYTSESKDGQILLFSYPTYAGYEHGKYIPVDVSASPACIYDGNIWFVTVIDNTYRISKLINGKLESYSIWNSDNTEIQFSSNIPESQDVRASLKLCADSEYIYALYSYQNKVTYMDEWNNDCSYIQDCTFELKKFAISDNDKKLIKLAECEVTAVEDFEITAEEQTSIFDGDFKVSDFMFIKESDNETSLYALLCEEPVRGGIAKFKSTITEGNHTLELGTINSRKLYGWWYSDTVAADLEELREAAQAVDELDNTHQLQFRTRYSLSQLKGRNPFELASLGDATITDYIREQWAENEQYYGPVDETAILNALVPVNEIIARIREAASAQTVMYAPQKFIARKPDELIIAEEDGYGYNENTNRVYSLNLRTLSVTKTTVNVSFNGYMDSGYHSF